MKSGSPLTLRQRTNPSATSCRETICVALFRRGIGADRMAPPPPRKEWRMPSPACLTRRLAAATLISASEVPDIGSVSDLDIVPVRGTRMESFLEHSGVGCERTFGGFLG
jgi:hypothetical protein